MFEDNSRVGALCEDAQGDSIASGPSDMAAMKHHDCEQRIFLPRGSAETRFAPPQYYYLASKSGAMPSWAVAVHHSAHLRAKM